MKSDTEIVAKDEIITIRATPRSLNLCLLKIKENNFFAASLFSGDVIFVLFFCIKITVTFLSFINFPIDWTLFYKFFMSSNRFNFTKVKD